MSARIHSVLRVLALAAFFIVAVCAEKQKPIHSSRIPSSRVASDKNCADSVTAYLFHSVMRRNLLVEKETAARAELNELRSAEAEVKDGQPATEKKKTISQERINAALSELKSASANVQAFDKQAMKLYGNLPTQCIGELEATRKPTNPETATEYLFHYAEILLLHGRLFAKTAKGVYNFVMDEYAPVVDKFHALSETFRTQSNEVLEQQKGRFEDAELSEKMHIALKYAEAATLASAPYIILFASGVTLLLFAPFAAGAVIVPHLLWRVWAQLFLLHHTFGIDADGLLAAARSCVDLAAAQDWAALKERLYKALVTFVGTGTTFFNGVVAAAIVAIVFWGLLLWMFLWVRVVLRLFCGGGGGSSSGSSNRASVKKDVPKGGRKDQNSGSKCVATVPTSKKKA